ncbi:hypothetical protein NMY22_g16610 [Coprinellus aureogranulatus]|nr:hypothetical protein NMY22_g16610 [Coprinellus aureogranulatus]
MLLSLSKSCLSRLSLPSPTSSSRALLAAVMDDESEVAWSQKCRCGKRFFQPNNYTHHIQGCDAYKRGVGNSLEAARTRWQAKATKPKRGNEAVKSWYGDGDLDVDLDITRPAEDPAMPRYPRQETPDPEPGPLGRGFRTKKPVERYDRNFEATSTMPFHFVPDTPRSKRAARSTETTGALGGPSIPSSTPEEEQRRSITDRRSWKRTQTNEFGLAKHYWTTEERPHDPDAYISISDILDNEPGDTDSINQLAYDKRYYPFPNLSSYLIGQWFWNDKEKSRDSLRQLISIITSYGFKPEELLLANWDGIRAMLSSSEYEDGPESAWVDDGVSWQTASVTIEVPFNHTALESGSKPYTVEGFRFRPLISVIRAKLEDSGHFDHFHLVPYELQWQTGRSAGTSRVYGELYYSSAFLDAYEQVQSLPPEPEDDHLPRYIVALMFSSDGTTLASFGNASLWPLYMWFGNESKYRRSKVSLNLVELVAHFQKVGLGIPSTIASNWFIRLSGKNKVGQPVATHLHRELFHAQWRLLLDDDFIRAYHHGLVVDCLDGVPAMGLPNDRQIRSSLLRVDNAERQAKISQARKLIYLQNYSVNSKKVEAILKPTSLVPTQNAFSERLSAHGLDVHELIAVDILHEVEIGVWKSLFIHLLRILDLVDPVLINTLNHRFRAVPTFGKDTIRRFSNNVSDMKQLAARDWEDMLQCATFVFEGLLPKEHEQHVHNLLFTMGHWHGLAKLRMHTDGSLAILDQWTALLGEDARTFLEQTCTAFETVELKREYEARKRREARKSKNAAKPQKESTQVVAIVAKGEAGPSAAGGTDGSAEKGVSGAAIPVQKPTKGRKSKKATAPQRTGPEQANALSSTLSGDSATNKVPSQTDGASSRPSYPVTGQDDRTRDPSTVAVAMKEGRGVEEGGGERKARTWNLNTPKFHALGDVVPYIRKFGTTDSYSTQLSERAHRLSKSRYRKTNKKDVSRQLSRIQARQARLQRLKRQLNPPIDELNGASDDKQPASGARWYFIGRSQNHPINLGHFIRTNTTDWTVKGFLRKLKIHLFPRVVEALILEARARQELYAGSISTLEKLATSFGEEDLSNVHFHSDRIYSHNIFKIRFTTYDCRADHDTFNPSTSKRDFICLRESNDGAIGDSGENDDYIYGRILGIFHANIQYSGPGALDFRRRRFDFLWVRWFLTEGKMKQWTEKQHDIISLAPPTTPKSCDFIDPTNVLRAAHVVPRFSSNKLYDPEGVDADRPFSKYARDRTDWKQYFVNRFVDRDMLMRFHIGLSPGHIGRASASHSPLNEPMDLDVPEQGGAGRKIDVQMEDDISTDSGDSDYDPLLQQFDDVEEPDVESDSSDVPDPDSCSEASDVFS